MLGWFRRHRKIRNGALYFLVSCFYCLPDDFFAVFVRLRIAVCLLVIAGMRHVSRGHRGPRSSLSSGPSRDSAVMLRALFLPVWAWLSVPVATESEVGARHVITVGPRQRHAGKRGCCRKQAQGTLGGRPGAIDVLQNLHGMSSGLFSSLSTSEGSAQP